MVENESSVFLNEAYRIVVGVPPDPGMSEHTRIEELMDGDVWDGSKLNDDLTHRLVGQQALAYIGTQWKKGVFTFPLELVARRLRELKPELGSGVLDLFVMRDLVRNGDKPIIDGRR